jgi:hypothetical protein
MMPFFKFIIAILITLLYSCTVINNKDMIKEDYFIHLYKSGQMIRYNVLEEKYISNNSINLEIIDNYIFFSRDSLGRVYFKIDDKYVRYYTFEDAKEVYQHFGEPYFSSDMFFGLIKFENGFLQDYKNITEDFIKKMNLSTDNRLLSLVDKVDIKILENKEKYHNQNFTSLISFVAKLVSDECTTKNKNISLKEIVSKDGITKVPVIKLNNGHEIPFGIYLYEYLYEHNSTHPIRDTYDTIMSLI